MADTPASALAALVRIHTSSPVMDMSTETPRATATTSATETLAPISNRPTPNVCHGIKPMIMTTNVRAKRTRTRF